MLMEQQTAVQVTNAVMKFIFRHRRSGATDATMKLLIAVDQMRVAN